MRLRAAVYRRVSTEEQSEEGLSLEVQDQRNLLFCKAQGWTPVRRYTDDSSGLDTDRVGYQHLLRDKDLYDIIVAVKRDRLHRSVDNARAFRDWAIENGKQVWSIAEGRLDDEKGAAE